MATIQSQARRNTQPKKPSKKSTASPPWFRNVRILSAAGGAALILLFAAVFFIRTPHGTLRVEILDPEVQLKVEGTELTFQDGRNEPVSLTTGDKRLIVTRGDLSFETETFALKKGQEILVKVELIQDRLVATSNETVIGEKLIGRSRVTASTTGQKTVNSTIVKPQPKTETAVNNSAAGLVFSPGDTVELPMASRPDKVECTLEAWLTPAIDIEARGMSVVFTGARGEMTFENSRFRFYTFHGHAQSEQLLQPGRRIHLAGVNDGKKRFLYLDGQLIATDPGAGGPNPDITPFVQKIGGECFRGVIEALRISSVARYGRPFKPPASFESDKETVALYRFDEGSGDVLRDSSGNGQHGKILGAEWVSGQAVKTPEPRPTGDVIDLLAKVKLPDDMLEHETLGEWTRDGQALISPGGGKAGRIQFNYEPPQEYEMTAVVERVSGSDGVMFGVIVDGYTAEVGLDIFNPPVSGLSIIAGKALPDTASVFKTAVLQDRNQHTIRIKVGKRSVAASVDDRQVLHWEGDPSVLTSSTTLRNPKQLWFGAAYDQFKFHKLELTPLVPSNLAMHNSVAPSESHKNAPWPFDPNDGQEYEWSEPENLGANINSDVDEWLWGVSEDERWLWFVRGQTAYVSERGSSSEPFGVSQPLLGVQTVSKLGAVSADGLTLVYSKSATDASEGIMLSERTQPTEPFSEPRLAVASTEHTGVPGIMTLSPDGLTLMMGSTRPPGRSSDIWVCTRDNRGADFGDLERLPEPINTIAWDTPCYISDDGNFLMTGARDPDGETRERRFFYFSRPSGQDPFPEGRSLYLNSDAAQSPVTAGGYRLTANGRAIYLQHPTLFGGKGGNDLWVYRRVLKTEKLPPKMTRLDDLTAKGYEGFDQVRKVGEDDAANGSLKNNFQGIYASGGLIVHPNGEPTGTCRVTYDLSGRYAKLRGTAFCRPSRGSPISAEIEADGKSLWKSGDLTQSKSAGAPFEVSVQGVRRLTLIATSEKELYAAHVLWREPVLFEATADETKSEAAP
jgi:hypothetical protein